MKLKVLTERDFLLKARKLRKKRRRIAVAKRDAKLRAISQGNSALPTDRKYPVLYVDAAWKFEWLRTLSGDPQNHYPVMSDAEIMALPVADLATPDAVLFMWVVSAKLFDAKAIMEAWGFEYKSHMVWVKTSGSGTGCYVMNQHEILLIATRGKPITSDESTPPHRWCLRHGGSIPKNLKSFTR